MNFEFNLRLKFVSRLFTDDAEALDNEEYEEEVREDEEEKEDGRIREEGEEDEEEPQAKEWGTNDNEKIPVGGRNKFFETMLLNFFQ